MRYIKEEEIKKINFPKKPIEIANYDMYYIKFYFKDGSIRIMRTFCEKGTLPDFHSREFEELQQRLGIDIKAKFFIERIVGPNGLLKAQGRDDYIYLGGDFCKGKYLANRYILQSNGKTGQENFDDNLFSLKLQVQAKEKEWQNKRINSELKSGGKTYVTGDIHGMYGSYIDVIKKINKNDKLIILGDVIDRGPEGIKIIQDMIKRKKEKHNNPQITFLLGNHEMQFLNIISIINKKNLEKDDVVNIMNSRKAQAMMKLYRSKNDRGAKKKYNYWKKECHRYNSKYQEIIKEKGLNELELVCMDIWINHNGGKKTIIDFLNIENIEKQNEIIRFLLNSYVVFPKNINNKDYLFVHSMPPKESQIIKSIKEYREKYKYSDLTSEQTSFMLEGRDDNSGYELAKRFGFTTICGHTPTCGKIVEDKNNGFIRIDAGCGHKRRKAKLALYCVNDEKVKYFAEKEEAEEQQEL